MPTRREMLGMTAAVPVLALLAGCADRLGFADPVPPTPRRGITPILVT